MDECIVLGIEYVSAYPLTVEVKLYVPPMGGGHINHNATARLSYPRRDGTFESFQD